MQSYRKSLLSSCAVCSMGPTVGKSYLSTLCFCKVINNLVARHDSRMVFVLRAPQIFCKQSCSVDETAGCRVIV